MNSIVKWLLTPTVRNAARHNQKAITGTAASTVVRQALLIRSASVLGASHLVLCSRSGVSYSVLRQFHNSARCFQQSDVDNVVKDSVSSSLEKESVDNSEDGIISQDLVPMSEEEQNLHGVQEVVSEDISHELEADTDGMESDIVQRAPAALLSLPELARRKPATLAPYVNRSETLQKLVQLGVDLSVVQQFEGMASLLVRSKFERDIAPYIKFLHQARVQKEKWGHVLTVNPHILTESVDDLEIRVGYLVHKKFSLSQVGAMLSRTPLILLMSPEQMDNRLGFLQETFGLSAEEVRQAVNSHPRLLTFKKNRIALTRFEVKSFLGFTDEELKQIILKEPKVFLSNSKRLGNNFDYLHNTVLIPHSQILDYPAALYCRSHSLRNRHLFLLSRHRAQFDPCKENYVSLKALVSGTNAEFCENVAKTDLKTYYEFLKTL